MGGHEAGVTLPALTFEHHFTVGNFFESGDGPEQGCLATSGRTEYGSYAGFRQNQLNMHGKVFTLKIKADIQAHILKTLKRLLLA